MAYNTPVYSTLYAFAGSALFLALATDVAYWASTDFVWLDMSDWLVSLGAAVGFLALIVGVFEMLALRRRARPGWLFAIVSFLAWIAAVTNALFHSRDGMTSVMPEGLIVSALTALLLIVAWLAKRSHNATTLEIAP